MGQRATPASQPQLGRAARFQKETVKKTERRTEDWSPEDAGEKEHGHYSSVGHKNEPKMDNCHSVSRVKAQGQDSLEAQLSLLESKPQGPQAPLQIKTYWTPITLSSWSQILINNSDDCGNILPLGHYGLCPEEYLPMQALGELSRVLRQNFSTLVKAWVLISTVGKTWVFLKCFPSSCRRRSLWTVVSLPPSQRRNSWAVFRAAIRSLRPDHPESHGP